MGSVELFFRFAGISQLFVLAAVLIKDHHDKISGLLIAAWALSGACYLAVVPAFRDWQWEAGSYVLLLGSLAWPVLFWLVAKSLFQDDFQLRWHHLVVLVLFVVVSLVGGAPAFRSGFGATLLLPKEIIVPQVLAVAFIILALAVVLKDWRDDLVENRRRLRFVLLVASGLYALITGLAVLVLLATPVIVEIRILDTIHVGMIFLLCLGVSIGFYSVHPEFVAASVTQSPGEKIPPEDFTPVVVELKRLMNEERVYREHGLTIGRLAGKLSQKEYKLRRIINGEFGYRNFNDFLNQHRIAEAARLLIAPATRRLPVLTIALDVGYSSLGPFNRAFKELVEMTPTEYRASAASSTTNGDPSSSDQKTAS